MHITGGDVFGTVNENTLLLHKLMLPPKAMGTVRWVAPAGNYNVTASQILRLAVYCYLKCLTEEHVHGGSRPD